MARKSATQVPPKPVVRAVAAVLLAGSIVVMYVVTVNFSTIGWPAAAFFLGALTTAGFSLASLITGDPEWILLDLIIPG